MSVDVQGMRVFLEDAIPLEELEILKDQQRLVAKNVSNQTRRTLYFVLREAGHTPTVARRCRHWHFQSIISLISIQNFAQQSEQRGEP